MRTPLPILLTCEVCGEEIHDVEDVRFEGDAEDYGYIHRSCGDVLDRHGDRIGMLLCIASVVWWVVLVVAVLRWWVS